MIITHMRLPGYEQSDDWVTIESPFGRLEALDLPAVLRELSNNVCGAISSFGDFATFKHAIPLKDMDPDEFAVPLALVGNSADELERRFTGGDFF